MYRYLHTCMFTVLFELLIFGIYFNGDAEKEPKIVGTYLFVLKEKGVRRMNTHNSPIPFTYSYRGSQMVPRKQVRKMRTRFVRVSRHSRSPLTIRPWASTLLVESCLETPICALAGKMKFVSLIFISHELVQIN